MTITSQKLDSWDFWQITNSVLNKGKDAVPPLFNGLEVLSSASDKAKLFAKNFSKNSNFDDSGISLPVFPSRTYLKLHNISMTPKMVRKVIKNLDSSKASGPDCIPVVVLKNCEPERLYIPQSVTKIVRLAPHPPLFNVGCMFACSFVVLAAWQCFFRLGTTLSQGEGGILGNFGQA